MDKKYNSREKSTPDSRFILENLWLSYFNEVMLKNGLISVDMHRKMKREILNRSDRNPKKR